MAELTPLILNNEMVKLRPTVGQARCAIVRKLIRNIKVLKQKQLPENPHASKNATKVQRFADEIAAAKTLKPNEVSKFALLNVKTLQELPITNVTTAHDRILYKIATSSLLVRAVDSFREKYPKWHMEVPFFLQRLGLQNQLRKNPIDVRDVKQKLLSQSTKSDDDAVGGDSGNKKSKHKRKRKDSESNVSEAEEVAVDENEAATFMKRFQEQKRSEKMMKKSQKHKKIVQRRGTLKTATPKRSNTRSGNPAPAAAIRSKDMVIKQLKLDQESLDDLSEMRTSTSNSPQSTKKSSHHRSRDTKADNSMENTPKDIDTKKFNKRTKPFKQDHDVEKSFDRSIHKRFESDKSRYTSDRKAKRDSFHNSSKEPTGTGKSTPGEAESLHPSWEAKRRERLIGSKPMGKKIKFDD